MRTGKRRWLCFAVILTVLAVFTAPTFAGSLEPSAPPGPTMKTLDEIPPTWSQKLPALERFELVLDGAAVLDKETGLVWEQSPDTLMRTWVVAISHCYTRSVGGRKGWRLPTVEELASLVDPSVISPGPTLPSGHPFTNVRSSFYWSSNNLNVDTTYARVVLFSSGNVGNENKTNGNYVWCVGGRQGHDAY